MKLQLTALAIFSFALTATAQKAPVQMAITVSTPIASQLGAAEIGSGTAPQVKDDLFSGVEKFAANASDISDVNLDSKMLGGLGKKDGIPGKMDFVVVHSYTYDKPGMYRIEDVQAFTRKLQDGSWNCFVHTRSPKTGESTDVCTRSSGDTNELVVVTAEPKELTFVHLKGRVSLSDLQNWDKSDKGSKGDKGDKGPK